VHLLSFGIATWARQAYCYDVEREGAIMNKQYECTWLEPEYEPDCKVVGLEFFSNAHGYDALDRARIECLTVGGMVDFDYHTVRRVS